MRTPIYDFLEKYAASGVARFHMPGHKGRGRLGAERYDITELTGADNLYLADGIIEESENNATRLFGTAHTFYSTEGSTLAIKAMLKLATGKNKRILAARAVHKSFVYAAALLDLDVEFIYGNDTCHYADSRISPDAVFAALREHTPAAVYITSPDYLGNISDVEKIAELCHQFGTLLLVDNAHGAYLNFLNPSRHPIALGADMCCDSAHKTLPALTGAAYLHISKMAPKDLVYAARGAMSLFASTSPSYLTMASLDLCNAYIEDSYSDRLKKTVSELFRVKRALGDAGISFLDTEPLKLVLPLSQFNLTLSDFYDHLSKCNIEPEMIDSEYAVFMVSPENTARELDRLSSSILSIPLNNGEKRDTPVGVIRPKRRVSIREAVFSESERVAVADAVGRICAAPTVACPPAVPIVISGEEIDGQAASLFSHYGLQYVEVLR